MHTTTEQLRDEHREKSRREAGRIHDEIVDSVLCKSWKMEIDDERLARVLNDVPGQPCANRKKSIAPCILESCCGCNAKLLKPTGLVYYKLKVVVLFEGCDAAGKGGVIKRVTQRLNPRTCRDGPLCQRRRRGSAASGISSVTRRHLPAGGEIVLFDRSPGKISWRRACSWASARIGHRGVFSFCPGVRADARAVWHYSH